jgi:hypothetical protein
VQADEREAELRVHDLDLKDAEALLRDAMLPMVGNVLEHVADRVWVEAVRESTTSAEIVVTLSSS